MEQIHSRLYKFKNQNGAQTPQKPYRSSEDYFLHIGQTVRFDLDQTYFATEVREGGYISGLVKTQKIVVDRNSPKKQTTRIMASNHVFYRQSKL